MDARIHFFGQFRLNRNLQRIPFKMMYNMFMLRHRFSNELWGEGALNHLLLFCKSVRIYIVIDKTRQSKFLINVKTRREFTPDWLSGGGFMLSLITGKI